MILSLGAAAAVSAHKYNETLPWTTSTVYATSVYTVTSCAPTVTNCPVGHVTTDIVSLYTTVCPVTATETTPPPYPSSAPGGSEHTAPPPSYPISQPGGVESSVSVPSYPISQPGGPVSSAPAPPSYPTSSPAGPILSTITISTCVPTYITSVITVTPTVTPTYSPSGAPSGGLPKPSSNSTIPFTGGASAKSAGGLLMAVGLVAALL